MHVAGSKASA